MEYPRVLYVGGQPIGAQSNSGLTLGAMFGDWPDERLLQIWMEHHPSAPTRGTSHVAEPMTSPFDAALRTTLTALKRARRGFSGAATPETDGMNSSVRRSTPMGARQRARISLQALNDIGPVRLPPSLRQEVSRFDPQVIHSLLGGVRVMRLTLALSRYMDVPIVPHFMDDWVSTLFTDGQLGGLARAQTERVIGQTLARSPLCLTIGADMRSEFQDRLKRRCFVVGNSVDISDYEQPVERRRSSAGLPLVMRYVGGLHLGRDVVVASIAKAIDEAGDLSQWALELFVPDEDRRRALRLSERFASVSYAGNIAPADVPITLMSADALLFVESEEPGILDFTRLSVSTKVPQYLASRRPTLVMGPQNQASVRTLLRGPLSVHAGPTPGDVDLRNALRAVSLRVVQNREPQSSGHAVWFLEEFGQAATQERLRASLTLAARSMHADGEA